MGCRVWRIPINKSRSAAMECVAVWGCKRLFWGLIFFIEEGNSDYWELLTVFRKFGVPYLGVRDPHFYKWFVSDGVEIPV